MIHRWPLNATNGVFFAFKRECGADGDRRSTAQKLRQKLNKKTAKRC